jgi:hypothetical protein
MNDFDSDAITRTAIRTSGETESVIPYPDVMKALELASSNLIAV